MPDALELLAEAHIRDWQRRVAAGEVQPTEGLDTRVESWESQTFRQVVGYRLAARAASDPEEAAALRQRANHLEITLLATVERDRPRLARVLAARLAAATA
jgi:hypothetical protein